MKELLRKIQQVNGSASPDPEYLFGIFTEIKNRFNYNLICKYGANKAQEVFDIIWHFLMEAACNKRDDIRIAANQIATIFLSKITPYYPNYAQQLFLGPGYLPSDNNPYAYLFIAQTFAFMTHDIEPTYIKDFLDKSQAQQYFACLNPKVSANILRCIQQLKNIHREWYSKLLDLIIPILLTTTPDQPMKNIILAIIQQCPQLTETLMDEINKSADNEIRNVMPVISYLISYDVNVSKMDLFPIAKQSMFVIQEGQDSTLIDAAFTILSVPSQSFVLNLREQGNNTNVYDLILNSKSSNNERITATINFNQLKTQNSSRFLLPLPNKIFENTENIGFLDYSKMMVALSNKVIRISKAIPHCNDNNSKKKKEKELHDLFIIFKNNLLMQNSDFIQPCLNAFAQCVSNFIDCDFKTELILLLRTLLFMDIKDETHQNLIFKVVLSIGTQQLLDLLGQKLYNRMQDYVIDTTLNSKPLFLSDFIQTLLVFAKKTGHSKIIDRIFDRIDVFDAVKLETLLRVASIVGEDADSLDINFLFGTINTTIEALIYNDLNLPFITQAFRYLSLFDLVNIPLNEMDDIPILMQQIIIESTNFITGSQYKTKQTKFESSLVYQEISKMCESSRKYIDVLGNTQTGSRIDIYPFLYYSLRLFNSMPTEPQIYQYFDIIKDVIVQIFPVMSSNCFLRYFRQLVRSDQKKIFRAMAPHLKRFPNIDIAAQWLKIAIDPTNADLMEEEVAFKNGLLKSLPKIPYLDTTGKLIQPRSLLVFAKAAMNIKDQAGVFKAIIADLKEHNPQQYKNFMILIRRQDEGLAFHIVAPDKPPELPIAFTTGVVDSMRQLANLAKIIYKEINAKNMVKEQSLESDKLREGIKDRLRNTKISDEAFLTKFGPYFSIAQLKFEKKRDNNITQNDIKQLLKYYCDNGYDDCVYKCVKYILEHPSLFCNFDFMEFQYPKSTIPKITSLLYHCQKRDSSYAKAYMQFIIKYIPVPLSIISSEASRYIEMRLDNIASTSKNSETSQDNQTNVNNSTVHATGGTEAAALTELLALIQDMSKRQLSTEERHHMMELTNEYIKQEYIRIGIDEIIKRNIGNNKEKRFFPNESFFSSMCLFPDHASVILTDGIKVLTDENKTPSSHEKLAYSLLDYIKIIYSSNSSEWGTFQVNENPIFRAVAQFIDNIYDGNNESTTLETFPLLVYLALTLFKACDNNFNIEIATKMMQTIQAKRHLISVDLFLAIANTLQNILRPQYNKLLRIIDDGQNLIVQQQRSLLQIPNCDLTNDTHFNNRKTAIEFINKLIDANNGSDFAIKIGNFEDTIKQLLSSHNILYITDGFYMLSNYLIHNSRIGATSIQFKKQIADDTLKFIQTYRDLPLVQKSISDCLSIIFSYMANNSMNHQMRCIFKEIAGGETIVETALFDNYVKSLPYYYKERGNYIVDEMHLKKVCSLIGQFPPSWNVLEFINQSTNYLFQSLLKYPNLKSTLMDIILTSFSTLIVNNAKEETTYTTSLIYYYAFAFMKLYDTEKMCQTMFNTLDIKGKPFLPRYAAIIKFISDNKLDDEFCDETKDFFKIVHRVMTNNSTKKIDYHDSSIILYLRKQTDDSYKLAVAKSENEIVKDIMKKLQQ